MNSLSPIGEKTVCASRFFMAAKSGKVFLGADP